MDKGMGALGILSSKEMVQALKMRHVTKLVTAQMVDWARIASELICRTLKFGPDKKEQ